MPGNIEDCSPFELNPFLFGGRLATRSPNMPFPNVCHCDCCCPPLLSDASEWDFIWLVDTSFTPVPVVLLLRAYKGPLRFLGASGCVKPKELRDCSWFDPAEVPSCAFAPMCGNT